MGSWLPETDTLQKNTINSINYTNLFNILHNNAFVIEFKLLLIVNTFKDKTLFFVQINNKH